MNKRSENKKKKWETKESKKDCRRLRMFIGEKKQTNSIKGNQNNGIYRQYTLHTPLCKADRKINQINENVVEYFWILLKFRIFNCIKNVEQQKIINGLTNIFIGVSAAITEIIFFNIRIKLYATIKGVKEKIMCVSVNMKWKIDRSFHFIWEIFYFKYCW